MKKEDYIGLIYRNTAGNDIQIETEVDEDDEVAIRYLDGRGPYFEYLEQILDRIDEGWYKVISTPKKELYEIY